MWDHSGTIPSLRKHRGLGRVKLTTIEKVWAFACPVEGTDIVQIGKAYITANHPNSRWMDDGRPGR